MNKYLRKKIVFKITDFTQNTNINKWYEFVSQSQYWSKAEIEAYHNEKLRDLVLHSYQNSVFYKNLFDKQNLTPNDIKTVSDLNKLPVIRREDIIKNYSDLLVANYKSFSPQFRSTGGTTGTPLKYVSGLDSWSLGWALKFRSWEWAGYKFGDKVGLFGGASLIPNQSFNLNRFMWNKINRFYPFSVAHVDSSILDKYIDSIYKNNIKILRGYPSSINYFAKYCLENSISIDVKAVITTAEVLTSEYRENIEKAFNCKVFDTYGCADAGGNISECKAHHLHISPEPSILELLNFREIDGQKKAQEMVFTNITNFAMPTIRYAPGDLAIADNSICSCGVNSSLVSEIVGRKTDILEFRNGRVLGGPALTLIFRKFNLENYQIVQNNLSEIDINIKPNKNYRSAEDEEIINIMRYHLGQEVTINLNHTDAFILPKSDKHRFIIKRVD